MNLTWDKHKKQLSEEFVTLSVGSLYALNTKQKILKIFVLTDTPKICFW